MPRFWIGGDNQQMSGGGEMIEQFNRILQTFGGHRVRLVLSSQDKAIFEISGWGVFAILRDSTVVERTGINQFVPTANSMWLGCVSLGYTRNDLGEVPA